MRKIFYAFTLSLFLLQNALANVIRDSEIEEVIEAVVAPVKKAGGVQNLKIYVIDDEVPNAFTGGGGIIFVHSGLIIKFPDPDVFRGVIAHEIGHILGQHVIRRQEVIDNYRLLAISSAAIGLLTAAGGGATGLAVLMAGDHIADRSVQAYSRAYESSADQAAVRLLERSGHSAIGMISFFEKMKIDSKSSLINPYEQTHPLGQERLRILKTHNKQSKYGASQNSDDLKYKFQRISVKLAAYTLPLPKLAVYEYKKNRPELTDYLEAIKNFRIGNFGMALKHLNKLLTAHPQDPYYHELKGQILFEAGNDSALSEYDMAVRIRKNDPLILLSRAVAGMNLYKNSPLKLDEFYNDLSFVAEKEPDNLLALYYLAIYYEKKGQKGKSYLNSAIIAGKTGHSEKAAVLAAAALKELPADSPDWHKASDIIAANKLN